MNENQDSEDIWRERARDKIDFRIIQGFVKGEVFCFRYLVFIFDMERVLLQPANSLLQPAKKVRN